MFGDNTNRYKDVRVRVVESASGPDLLLRFDLVGTGSSGRAPEKVRTDKSQLATLLTQIADLRVELNEGRPTDPSGLATLVRKLAKKVLPPHGLFAFATSGSEQHVERIVIEVDGATASQIPWELFSEEVLTCSSCERRYASTHTVRACTPCDKQLVRRTEVLAAIGLVHHVDSSTASRAECSGNRFLMILGEGEDFHTPESLSQFERMATRLRGFGYQVEVLSGQSAEAEVLLNAFEKHDIVGVYFYGHAETDGAGTRLRVAKNSTLSASEVREVSPSVPFAFINACGAAEGGENSLAAAFAGPNKLVIAPTGDIGASDGQTLALMYIERATSPKFSLLWRDWVRAASEYVGQLKRMSVPNLREAAVKRDVTVGSYRLFDGGLKHLPPPQKGAIVPFRDGRLDLDCFSRELAQIIWSTESRPLDIAHLLDAMWDHAQLLSYLSSQLLLDRAPASPAQCDGHDNNGHDNNGHDNSWFPEEHVADCLRTCIEQAAKEAAQREERKITEFRLLEQIAIRSWPTKNGDPRAVDFRAVDLRAQLERSAAGPVQLVDPHGYVNLTMLTADACRVIAVAYKLDPQLGASALLQGLLAADCSKEYRDVLKHLPRAPGKLEEYDCAPRVPADRAQAVLLPLLRKATEDGRREIDPHHLFTSYCRLGLTAVRDTIRLQWHVDLSSLGCRCAGPVFDPTTLDDGVRKLLDRLDPSARLVLYRFAQLAQLLQSWSNRVMLAAFFSQQYEHTAAPLRHLDPVSRKELSEYLIAQSVGPADQSAGGPVPAAALQRIQQLAKALAAMDGTKDATALLRLFKSEVPPALQRGLKRLIAQRYPGFDTSWIE